VKRNVARRAKLSQPDGQPVAALVRLVGKPCNQRWRRHIYHYFMMGDGKRSLPGLATTALPKGPTEAVLDGDALQLCFWNEALEVLDHRSRGD
jgi:hypothetical protein